MGCNIKKTRSWSKPSEDPQTIVTQGLTSNKIILCVWWAWKGIIYYE